jgi:hypothetical protein
MSEEGENNHEWHQKVELRTVIVPGKWRNAQEEYIRFTEGKIAKQVVRTSSGL